MQEMFMKIYTVISIYKPVPIATFTDYHELIVYVRRRKIDTNTIYQSIANDWNDTNDIKDISGEVYTNAYNGFEHYKDQNY